MAILYIPVICGSALIIGPVQSVALSHLTHEQNPHGVTVMSTGFQIAGCIGSSLFTGVYSMCAAAGSPSAGFNASGILAAALAIIGVVLSIIINRYSAKAHIEKKEKSLEATGIATVMKKDVFSVSVHATVLDALKCMTEKKTGGLPILADDGHVAGFISDGDIVRFMLDADRESSNFAHMYPLWHDIKALDEQMSELEKYNVMELANRKVIAVNITDDVRTLFKILSDKKIKKVPVLNNGIIVGTASRSDLLRKMVSQSPVVSQ